MATKLRAVFWKDTKFDRASARLRKKAERTQITKIRNERGDVTTGTTETHGIRRDFWERHYADKLGTT